MRAEDPKDIVRRGYDAVSYLYRDDTEAEGGYGPWIAGVRGRVAAGGAVLDLGCGCGVPVVRALSSAGYRVTGVDISETQVRRGRKLVPEATFIQADMSDVDFARESFDAVVSFYAMIHLPLAEQPALLSRIAGWLRPGGTFVATVGHTAWTGTEDDWLGSGATMWWSHVDAATYRSWITEAGLIVEGQEFVPEEISGHASFWTRRP